MRISMFQFQFYLVLNLAMLILTLAKRYINEQVIIDQVKLPK